MDQKLKWVISLNNKESDNIRIALLIEYNGKSLVGWQKQNNGISVQGELEKCAKILFKIPCKVQGAGRTDAGVNALGQVAHIDIPSENRFSGKNNFFIVYAFNALLIKTSIRVISIQNVSLDFNARFSALKRIYIYKFLVRSAPPILINYNFFHIRKKLDTKKMADASKYFLGKHDFSSFRSSSCQSSSPIKTIDKIKFKTKKKNNLIIMQISAKSFLHNQVRIIVGTLIKVGLNEWAPEKIKEILESKSRSYAAETAPAQGLYLKKVYYPDHLIDSNWPERIIK